MLKIRFTLKNATKTCYRFEHQTEDGQFITLYLKKNMVYEDGINVENGILVTIEEGGVKE